MKKYALFTINYPENEQEKRRISSAAPSLTDINGNSKNSSEHTRRLHEGTYLIDVEQDLPLLGELTNFCQDERNRVPSYDILLFDTDREWTTYPATKR